MSADIAAGASHRPQHSAPPVLPGFEHVNRFWDHTRGMWGAKILPGEYYVTVTDELIGTVLGSCISACIRDPVARVGGMNHFMLPEGDGSWGGTTLSLATRYGSFAMEHLINDLMSHGGRKSRMEVKLFGGGRILANMNDVGRRNIEFAHRFLREDALRLVGEDVGDVYPRKVVYDPMTGRAFMKRLKSVHNQTIVRREENYRSRIEHEPVAGEIELF